MKNPIQNLNKAFENKVRLGVMAALMVNSRLSFNELKDLLELTDGNLASHIKALEKEKFISVNKTFVGKKPNTTYAVTTSGSKAFEQHLKALEDLINNQNILNK
ncbi:transcriptional regulator [Draconibacterium sp. IB214405]|uniref:winged helix-turn-helix domain-containing protein n=1 Tax=Draconibacterium sp. IB214405 TaxID=3097352 RepID=UPI0025DC1799|nr:transcriptional regulator [Draconibacterium sp. IB214405]MDX8340397.1 transcriptional regulator [Draconibacterium sp. IB214405]